MLCPTPNTGNRGQGGSSLLQYAGISHNQIPLGNYLGCDTYIENVAIFKTSNQIPTIGSAPFGQALIIPRICPYAGMMGHKFDRRITQEMK